MKKSVPQRNGFGEFENDPHTIITNKPCYSLYILKTNLENFLILSGNKDRLRVTKVVLQIQAMKVLDQIVVRRKEGKGRNRRREESKRKERKKLEKRWVNNSRCFGHV